VLDAGQINEPQEPDSASTRPDAQKTCAARNVFKKEIIDRQQQSDVNDTMLSSAALDQQRLIGIPQVPEAGRRNCGNSSRNCVVHLDLAGSARSIITIDSRAVSGLYVKAGRREITQATRQGIYHITQLWGVLKT